MSKLPHTGDNRNETDPDDPKRQPGGDNGTIRFRCFLRIGWDVMPARGWQGVDSGEWDINWCRIGQMEEFYDPSHMREHARISHFPNHYELTRKNLMIKNLKRFKKEIEGDSGKGEASTCDFFPVSYELPSEYHIFLEEFERSPGSTWIMKPARSSEGKGIFLFNKLEDITEWKGGEQQNDNKEKEREEPETYIVQRYIENPYLIGGRKSDIRLYVLVVSYSPLKVWLYREGLVRFSNSRYSMESIDDLHVHLTNVSVQKTALDYNPEEAYHPEKGCKWSMLRLRQYLTAGHGMDVVEALMNEIHSILILSLQSVQKIIISDKRCFELYGYDILLDDDLKPWLIEVNATPSLTATGQQDYSRKFAIMDDVLNVLDMERRLTGDEKRIGGFDLLWCDGPVYANERTGLNVPL